MKLPFLDFLTNLTAASAGSGADGFVVKQGSALRRMTLTQIQAFVFGSVPSSWRVLARSGVAAAITGTTSETTLATINIPAGTLGVNGRLRVTSLWSMTNNANNKTARARLAGNQLFTATAPSVASLLISREIANRNSLSAQVGYPAGLTTSSGTSTTAVSEFTVNMAVAQDLTLTMALANAADTATLESYTVEVLA